MKVKLEILLPTNELYFEVDNRANRFYTQAKEPEGGAGPSRVFLQIS